MENPPPPPPQKKKNRGGGGGGLGIFCLELGKNMLFGIGNGAEFRPQNRVIESPVRILDPYYTVDEIYQILHEYNGSLHPSIVMEILKKCS